MRLRERKNCRPGRYREGNIYGGPPSPEPNPPVREVEYDPDLPAATFPTVPLGTRAPGKKMDLATGRAIDENDEETNEVDANSKDLSGDENAEQDLPQLPEGAQIQNNEGTSSVAPPFIWKACDNVPAQGCNLKDRRLPFLTGFQSGDPTSARGEAYNGFVARDMFYSDGTILTRYFPKLHEEYIEWSSLSDGLQLILIRELSRDRPIHSAWDFLELSIDDRYHFSNFYNRELYYREAEVPMIQSFTRSITNFIMSGGLYTSDELSGIYEEGLSGEYGATGPTVFSFQKRDIDLALEFLTQFQCGQCGYVDRAMARLKTYAGASVTMSQLGFDFDKTDEEDEESEDEESEDEESEDEEPEAEKPQAGELEVEELEDERGASTSDPNGISGESPQSDDEDTAAEPAKPKQPNSKDPWAQIRNVPYFVTSIPIRDRLPPTNVAASSAGSPGSNATVANPDSPKKIFICEDGSHLKADEYENSLERNCGAQSGSCVAPSAQVNSQWANGIALGNDEPAFVINNQGIRIDSALLALAARRQDELASRKPNAEFLGSDSGQAGAATQDSILKQPALNSQGPSTASTNPTVLNDEPDNLFGYANGFKSVPPSASQAKNLEMPGIRTLSKRGALTISFTRSSGEDVDIGDTEGMQAVKDVQQLSMSKKLPSKSQLRAQNHEHTLIVRLPVNLPTSAGGMGASTSSNKKGGSMGKKVASIPTRTSTRVTRSSTLARRASEGLQKNASQAPMDDITYWQSYTTSKKGSGGSSMNNMGYDLGLQSRNAVPQRHTSSGFASQSKPTLVQGSSTYIDRIRKYPDPLAYQHRPIKRPPTPQESLPMSSNLSQSGSGGNSAAATDNEPLPSITSRPTLVDYESSSSSSSSELEEQLFGGRRVNSRRSRENTRGVNCVSRRSPMTPRDKIVEFMFESSSDSGVLPTKPSVKNKLREVSISATSGSESAWGRPATPSDKISMASSDNISESQERVLLAESLPTERKLFQKISTSASFNSDRTYSNLSSSFVQGAPDLPNPFQSSAARVVANSGALATAPTRQDLPNRPGTSFSRFTQKLQEAKIKLYPRTEAPAPLPANFPILTSKMDGNLQEKNQPPSAQGAPDSSGQSKATNPNDQQQPVARVNPCVSAPEMQPCPPESLPSNQYSTVAGQGQTALNYSNMGTAQNHRIQDMAQGAYGRKNDTAVTQTSSPLAPSLPSNPPGYASIPSVMPTYLHSSQIFEQMTSANKIIAAHYTAYVNRSCGIDTPQLLPSQPAAPSTFVFGRNNGSKAGLFASNFHNGFSAPYPVMNAPLPVATGAPIANQNISLVPSMAQPATPIGPIQPKQHSAGDSSKHAYPTNPVKRDKWVSYVKSPSSTKSKPLMRQFFKSPRGSAGSTSAPSAAAPAACSPSMPTKITGEFVPIKFPAASASTVTAGLPRATFEQVLSFRNAAPLGSSQNQPETKYGSPIPAIGWVIDSSEPDPQKKLGALPPTLEEKTRLASKKKLDASRESSVAPSESSESRESGDTSMSSGKNGKRKNGPEESAQDRSERYAKRSMMKDGSSMGTKSVSYGGENENA